MMKKLLLALGACVLPVSIFAATYVVPVATARLKDRIYSTTLAFHNEGSLPARCEAIYAVPNDPKGGTLRATYEIAAGGAPLVEEDVLRDVGAIGTMRIVCTSDVAIAARIQSSSDGLTFDEGRTFAALREDAAVAHGALPTIRAFGDVVVAEVAGKPVTVEAIVRDPDGVEFGRKTYDIPAFAQQLVNLSKGHAHASVAIVDVHVIAGDGAIVGADETRDTALLKMAVRMRPERRAALNVQAREMAANTTSPPASSVIRSLGTAAFKAAPFQDPFTGLIFMRERWYDPQTGTFLSTDPEGYADSANLYSYCHGDPVNCTDPTGRLGDGGDLRADFREKENAERAKRFAAWCNANPVECRRVDVRGAGIMRMIGGVGQTTAGVGAFASSGPLPEPVTKGLGATAIVRGIDNTVTGAVELWTGEQHDTVTGRALYLAMVRAGVSRQTASRVTGWTETGVDIVSTVGSSLVPGVNRALATRVASAPRALPGVTGLRFGGNDLVYGPSARGYLRSLQQEAGGVLLDDLPKPTNLTWEQFTTRTLDDAARSGRAVRFDLTHVDDLSGVLNNTGEWADTITGHELRYLRANWSRFHGIAHFYRDGVEVVAPWVR
jgi:RHS repeat-associated protein